MTVRPNECIKLRVAFSLRTNDNYGQLTRRVLYNKE